MKRKWMMWAAGAAMFWSAPASADLTAHFRAESIDGGCVNGDSEAIGAGDPDRYFRMAIFDEYSLNQSCASGCTDDGNTATEDVRSLDYCPQSTGCDAWNFANQTVSKVVPAGGVYFYFGLWDADSDADDSLGDHWFFANGPRTNRTDSNNNNSPYNADSPIVDTCSGRDVEGDGSSGNYDLTYSVWFTDTTDPDVSSSTPVHNDDGFDDLNDNDTRLNWTWTPANDPDTGIDGYEFSLYDATTSTTIFNTQSTSSSSSISFCPSGCTRSLTPQHGHEYRLRVRATNGKYPTINNAAAVWSSWSENIEVDLVDPVADLAAPAAGSWHNGDFSVDFQDDDDGTGVDTSSCRWRIESQTTTTSDWSSRACNASRVVTVGPGQDCRHEGADVCEVSTQNTDDARRSSATGTRTFGIDWTQDSVGPVMARTTAGGPTIVGWTTDRDPHFSWAPAASTAPIVGYSWSLNSSPDCGSIEVAATDPLEVQITTGFLADGVHSFQVRAIDAAGNCGPVSVAAVQIDPQGDAISNFHARNGAGSTIPTATWQREDAPTLHWDAPFSASPIVGYSWGTGANTDCTVDVNATTATPGTIAQGATTFWVRAIDAAGNCGNPASLALQVDSQAEDILNLRAFNQQGGTPIFASTPQPDRDPWMQWDVPVSLSPIAGYAFGTGAMTDCAIDTTMPGAGLSMLPDGTTTFWVRAIDAAGNCGTASFFDVVVADCGDGITGPGEQCDDGNTDDNDSCVSCVDATCGDGYLWAGHESCDEGADNSDTEPDACRTDCVSAYCGDGVLDSGESCDAGAANSDVPGSPCRTNCALATCGDGVIDAGEQCDDGPSNSDSVPGACRTTCVPAFCGDGVLDLGESCDEGVANSDIHPNACRRNCAMPACGDGVIDPNEVCDDGDANDDLLADACRTTCLPAACGDGVVDSFEECEPGDVVGDLVCMDDCSFTGSEMDDPGHPDMGSQHDAGSPGAPDMAGPTQPTEVVSDTPVYEREPEELALNEATCCAQVASRTYSGWQLVLAGVLLWRVRRRRSRCNDRPS